MKYWQERQQQLNDQLEKDEEKLKIKLSKSYDIEQKKLEKEIASYYQTYGEDNVIEYRKLMESLSDEDKQLLLQRMDEFAEKYPQYAHLMPVRESIYKLNRLEGLQTSIKMQQLEIGAIDNAELQSHLEQLALRSANSSAEQLGFGKNFYTINSDLITKTVGKQWADGKNFSERIWSNREKLADYLNNDFAMAIARGDSYQRCIKALGERFEKVSRHDIYRLIYTEGTFVQNEASITPFEEDFEEYQISIADERACKHCKAMRDKKFSIKDRKAGVNFPPFHCWCRCSFTIAVDDWDKWMDDYVEKHSKEPENSVKSVAKSGESGMIKEVIEPQTPIEYREPTKDDYSKLGKNMRKKVAKEDINQLMKHEKSDGSPGGYVATHNYSNINSNMRNDNWSGNQLDADDEKTIEALKKAIKDNTLDDDYILTRYVNADYLTSVFGVKQKSLKRSQPDEVISNSILSFVNSKKQVPRITEELQVNVGKIVKDKAFLSTSMLPTQNIMKDKAVLIKIKAQKGTNAFIPNNRKESECILMPGAERVIESIVFDEVINKWVITEVVK